MLIFFLHSLSILILTHPHQWHPHAERCASWLGGTPLCRPDHPAEHAYNEWPAGTGRHSWSHLLGKDKMARCHEYTFTCAYTVCIMNTHTPTTLYDGSEAQVTCRTNAMHHKDKVVHLFWFTWEHRIMMSTWVLTVGNTSWKWIIFHLPTQTHTIGYFDRDVVHSPLDCPRACLLRGGWHPLVLQSYWLILHYQLREEQGDEREEI